MIVEVPNETIRDYLPYFSEHVHFRGVLEGCFLINFGKCFVDDLDNPDILLYSNGFENYLAGNPDFPEIALLLDKINEKEHIYVPSPAWEPVLSNHWERVYFFYRTDFSSESLDRVDHGSFLQPLPEGFTLERMDFAAAKEAGYDVFPNGTSGLLKAGVCFCIKDGTKIASFVAAPELFNYEINIRTFPEYQRRGFSMLVVAHFLIYCRENSIVPKWSAAHDISASMALKLGFTKPEPYRVYYWHKEPAREVELKEWLNEKYQRGIKKYGELEKAVNAWLEAGKPPTERERLVAQSVIANTVFEDISTKLCLVTGVNANSAEYHDMEAVMAKARVTLGKLLKLVTRLEL